MYFDIVQKGYLRLIIVGHGLGGVCQHELLLSIDLSKIVLEAFRIESMLPYYLHIAAGTTGSYFEKGLSLSRFSFHGAGFEAITGTTTRRNVVQVVQYRYLVLYSLSEEGLKLGAIKIAGRLGEMRDN